MMCGGAETAGWANSSVYARPNGGLPWFCIVRVNTSYSNAYPRYWQRTIAHELGHCLASLKHNSGVSILNPYRYSKYPTDWDRRQANLRWSGYGG